MTWVIKAGRAGDNDGDPEYLKGWEKNYRGDEVAAWTFDQRFAWRFDDRNTAVKVATGFPVSAYADDVRPVKLRAAPEPCDERPTPSESDPHG